MRFKHTHKSTTLSVADFNTLHMFDISLMQAQGAHTAQTTSHPHFLMPQSHSHVKQAESRHRNCHGIVTSSAAKLAEKRGSEDRDKYSHDLPITRDRNDWVGSVISRVNTNSTQISIARTTATVILACHRSQQCWFQFRKTTKFFERDKINQNFVSIV